MKIAIVVDTFPSVSETFISNKAKHLSTRGHHVIVFCAKKNIQLFDELFDRNSSLKVVVLNKQKMVQYLISHPFTLAISIIKGVNFRQRILKRFRLYTIRQYIPDIIHFEFSGIGVDYLYEIKRLTSKKVISCRGSAEKVKLLIYEDRKKKFKELLNHVDAVHCVSDDIRKTILPYLKDHKKLFINYPSIDTAFFERRIENKNRQILTILSVGRLTFQKGYSTGLLAIALLKNKGIPFKWMIVGSGPNYEEIRFQIHELGLNEFVVLLGSKSGNEIKQLMEKADIYLLSSVYEGVANVVLEAMSMELPVVSTRSGGMEEVITHRKNGLLADVYDHVTLSQNLFELLRNPDLRTSLGKAARREVKENFDLQIQINKFEQVYCKLYNSCLAKRELETLKDPIEKKEVYYHKSNIQKKKLRIGVIIPQFPSYTETFFINKIIGLCKRGHEVIVFCNAYNSDPLLNETYSFHKYSNLQIVTLDFNSTSAKFLKTVLLNPLIILRNVTINRKSFKRNAYLSLLKHYFQQSTCDVYHFGYSGLAIAYSSVLNSLNGKVVISCRGTAENVKPITEEGRIEKLRELFDKVDRIHCVSGKMAETIKHYGAMDEKIFINRPAVDTTFFSRKKPYAPCEHINILSIGRLIFQKGFFGGILAILELKKRFQNFTWTIIGEGPEKEELVFHINSLELTNHVKLVEKRIRDEVVNSYDENDIFFLPSVCEGIANVVLEAMAMELPVVSTINGGIREVISDQANGILCDTYDFTSMGQQLFNLCINFEKRKQLGECARKTIENNFSIKRYIDIYEKEYFELIQ